MSHRAFIQAEPFPAAYLSARWGMSPTEVEQANGSSLRPPVSGRRFYQSQPGAEGRYKTLEASGQKFLGREAAVSYTFKDNRLFTYHVFVADDDAAGLDTDMRRYLTRVFGPLAGSVEEEDSSLKEIWHFKDRMVNYWFFEDELAILKKFKAGFGVVYKPIETD